MRVAPKEQKEKVDSQVVVLEGLDKGQITKKQIKAQNQRKAPARKTSDTINQPADGRREASNPEKARQEAKKQSPGECSEAKQTGLEHSAVSD